MPKKTAPLDLGLTRLPVILPICPRGTSDHVWGETALESLGWCITRQHGVRHHQHHLPHDHDHHIHRNHRDQQFIRPCVGGNCFGESGLVLNPSTLPLSS